MSLPPFPLNNRSARLAVLISGGGTTLANLLEHIAAGKLQAEVVSVICSNRSAQQAVQEKKLSVDPLLIERKSFADTAAFSNAIFTELQQAKVDLVCLAGFLSLLEIPAIYTNRVLNIHPSLLPAFGGKGMHGRHVHEAVLKAGVKITGCTVHFADPHYDTGPIVLQHSCPVMEDDTPQSLAARVFHEEQQAYPQAIQLVLDGRVQITGGRTRIQPPKP